MINKSSNPKSIKKKKVKLAECWMLISGDSFYCFATKKEAKELASRYSHVRLVHMREVREKK